MEEPDHKRIIPTNATGRRIRNNVDRQMLELPRKKFVASADGFSKVFSGDTYSAAEYVRSEKLPRKQPCLMDDPSYNKEMLHK